MSVLFSLFFAFLKIGALSFGGGYGMIALMRETVLAHGWMDEAGFLNLVALSESTPGPLAVNLATFVGSSAGGFAGALLATLGVVLPSFLLLLAIAALLQKFLKYRGVEAFLSGVRPAVVALILATALTMILSHVCGLSSLRADMAFQWPDLILFILIAACYVGYRLFRKKAMSPIVLILVSGGLGILVSAIAEGL